MFVGGLWVEKGEERMHAYGAPQHAYNADAFNQSKHEHHHHTPAPSPPTRRRARGGSRTRRT